MHAYAQNVPFRQWIKTTPRAEGIEVVPENQLASCAETEPSPPQDQRGVACCAKSSMRLICPAGLPTPPSQKNHQPQPVGDSIARSSDLRCQPISLVWAARAVKKVSKQFALMGT